MFVIALANAIIGILVGMTGIAGFLLPMLYAGFLGYTPTEALAFSFLAFIVSGSLGAFNYYRVKQLDLPLAATLSIGSLIGALVGVRLNLWLPTNWVTIILYLVVLASGLAILIQQRHPLAHHQQSALLKNKLGMIILGLLTGSLCALSGAGGPVLVMPLLVLLGAEPHLAVGVALLNSVAISLPAAIGYLTQINASQYLTLFIIIVIAHGLGVWLGSSLGPKLKATLLKSSTAIFSVAIAGFKLFSVWHH